MDEFLILIVLSGFVSISQEDDLAPSVYKDTVMCRLPNQKPLFDYEYYQRGDVIIGGLFSVHLDIEKLSSRDDVPYLLYYCSGMDTSEYESLLPFFFAIDEINKNPYILPNITLGYHLFDTCGYSVKAIHSTLRILSGYRRKAPNYSCTEDSEVAGFVGDTTFLTTLAMAQLLSIYQYTQISHRVTDILLSDRQQFPNFYRTSPSNWKWYDMVIKILERFGWNWVGIMTSSDGTGEMELRELRKEMTKHGICIEFVIYLTDDMELNRQRLKIIETSTTEVIVVCGHFIYNYVKSLDKSKALRQNITLFLNDSWNVVRYSDKSLWEICNCSLQVLYPLHKIPGLYDYMSNIHPSTRPADPLLEDIWLWKYNCSSSNRAKNKIFRSSGYVPNATCTGTESYPSYILENDPKLNYLYTAVYALANAMDSMKPSRDRSGKYGLRQKLHRYIQKLRFARLNTEMTLFDEKGEVPTECCSVNLVFSDPQSEEFIVRKFIYTTSLLLNMRIQDRFNYTLQWKQGKAPKARCNDPCPLGFRKSPSGGIHACCYTCVLCSDGEISNVTDSEICHKCPDDQRPDERKVICIPNTYEYLSYEMDIMVHTFSFISIICSFATVYILTLFILFRDSPVVKANNRTVSFILLTSILLSFLCVFLFLGRPVDITCMLRQVSFGVFFSIAVSCVLAKTITVCIAFKASKPGSYWRKWVGEKNSNSVVIICSSVQALICIIWLSVSPPYQEYDMNSSPGKVIIQCNEGSVIGFYSVLGYMGLLAAVSFVLAFMVRTLPDSFNEAKYITFSMLVFCSVWIAMIPAYLSTRGKYMVAVEIFAILASSAGLLGCIFFPKCYIIIIKPERNSKRHILHKAKS